MSQQDDIHNCASTELSFLLLELDPAVKEASTLYIYPSICPSQTNVCIHRGLHEGRNTSFLYIKVKHDWIYVILKPKTSSTSSSSTSTLCLCLIARSFNPEKYCALGNLLLFQYISYDDDPTKMLAAYLSIHMTGNFIDTRTGKLDGPLSFQTKQFPDGEAMKKVCLLKEIFLMIGADIIVLFNAVLLKKRILVFGNHENVIQLLQIVRTLPQLAWHRQDWSILRPLVSEDCPEHVDDLNNSGVFIAGTLDESLTRNVDICDVVFDVSNMIVSVNAHAKSGLKMCAIHRELSALLDKAFQANPDITSHELLSLIVRKTSSIINQLQVSSSLTFYFFDFLVILTLLYVPSFAIRPLLISTYTNRY